MAELKARTERPARFPGMSDEYRQEVHVQDRFLDLGHRIPNATPSARLNEMVTAGNWP